MIESGIDRNIIEPGVSEPEHLYDCPVCGQSVDSPRPGDVLHHEQPEHERLSELCTNGEPPSELP